MRKRQRKTYINKIAFRNSIEYLGLGDMDLRLSGCKAILESRAYVWAVANEAFIDFGRACGLIKELNPVPVDN